jgi:hypothetical protein
VCGVESQANLPNYLDSSFWGQFAFVQEQAAKVIAFDILHGNEFDVVSFGEIVDSDDIPVGNLVGRQQLLFESRQDGGVRGEVRTNQFKRYESIQFAVRSFVNGAHSAFAQQLEDFVAAAYNVAGL